MLKNDAVASLFLLTLLLGVFLFFRYIDRHEGIIDAIASDSIAATVAADSYPQDAQRQTPARYYRKPPRTYVYDDGSRTVPRLSPFDPNTADSTQLLSLGLPPWMVSGIYKYRAKGGVYRTPEDFAQVPGLTLKQYRELEPYIVISADFRPASESVQRPEPPAAPRDSVPRQPKLQPGEQIDLNAADTTQLKLLPGVGSYYARLIVNFRTRLGGFVDIAQLYEIEKLPESTVVELEPFLFLSLPVNRININTATPQQLRQHPYIGYLRAKVIAEHRRQAPITSEQSLAALPQFSQVDLDRLRPYLEY